MNFVKAQRVRFEGIDYTVLDVDEVLEKSNEGPYEYRVHSVATLAALDGSHQLVINALNPDNFEILEDQRGTA